MSTIVEFRHVAYAINGRSLVEDVSFCIESGETVVFLGRSGSGKTTTLKLINRLIEPTSGAVLVEGRGFGSIEGQQPVGAVEDDADLHVLVGRSLQTADLEDDLGAVAVVGLDPEHFAKRLPRELSGGQRQRVGVARALAADPSLLLLDEPFGALDAITRSEIQKEFRELRKRLGKTMVFVTHDMREAFILGDRIGLMKDGHLLALVPAGEFHKLDHPEARAFSESWA